MGRVVRMEVTMSLVRLPLPAAPQNGNCLLKSSLLPSHRITQAPPLQTPRHRRLTAVQAKGKRGMPPYRQFQKRPTPALPKLEDDGNPKFLIFIRAVGQIDLWYPLSVVTGGTTAKIMLSAKDNFLGKYIYKDALDRNLAAVIYNDEENIQELAKKQHAMLRDATKFRYGYKLVENNNLKAALSPKDIIVLPRKSQLKTVADKVKDYFEEAKKSFGKLLSSVTGEDQANVNKGRRRRGRRSGQD